MKNNASKKKKMINEVLPEKINTGIYYNYMPFTLFSGTVNLNYPRKL